MRISDWSSDVCSSDLKAQTYVDISRLLDAVMGHFGQIPEGRPNGFHLGPKAAWKGTQPSRRALWPELFAIWTPRWRCNLVWTLICWTPGRSPGSSAAPRMTWRFTIWLCPPAARTEEGA